MNKPYRPSNGTEGRMFEEEFCVKCVREAEFWRTSRSEDACPIHNAAIFYDTKAPEYPKEWVQDGDDFYSGRCTKFEKISTGKGK